MFLKHFETDENELDCHTFADLIGPDVPMEFIPSI